MRSSNRGILVGVALVLSLSVLLAGCGGGGSSEVAGPHGSMNFAVTFPPMDKGNDKVLPSALMSVVIDILEADASGNPAKVDPVLLNRPDVSGGSVSASVENVGVGNTLIRARGFDAAGGGGKLIIIASTTCVVRVNETVSVSMTMGTTTTTIILNGPSSVLVGNDAILNASATDIEGNSITDPNFAWTSSDETVATVSPFTGGAGVKTSGIEQAKVRGEARGAVTITVTDGVSGATATLDMAVNPNIDLVTVDPDEMTVNKNKSHALNAQAFASDTPVGDVDFTFTSEDETIATVQKSITKKDEATVTGVAAGKTRIRVTQPYTGAKAYCDVTVTETGSIDITLD